MGVQPTRPLEFLRPKRSIKEQILAFNPAGVDLKSRTFHPELPQVLNRKTQGPTTFNPPISTATFLHVDQTTSLL